MPNDTHGHELKQGDRVQIKGSIVELKDDPNFDNCVIQLDVQMAPTGTQTKLRLNSTQVEKAEGQGQSQGPPQQRR